VSSLVSESIVYGGAWSTPELRAIFDEIPRTTAWIEILAVLAETEAAFGLVPSDEAAAAAAACRATVVDGPFLEELRAAYQTTGHSLVGLLEAVASRCPGTSGEWLCYGATVQDITDTWLMGALGKTRVIVARDLAAVDARLTALAREHRDTPMAGRTHGQVGLAITFGAKAVGWLAEVRRHRTRLEEVGRRLDVGQLAGGVGSLSALGPQALAVQERFLATLGLGAPDTSWTASRDRLAEWCFLLTLIAGTADRIGHEVYNLARPEIGELSEGLAPGNVGSITMPHKRNPEVAEHLGTLSRIVRHNGAIVAEGLVGDHERDGRSWKGEWQAVPAATMAAGTAIALLRGLLEQLEVHPDRMRANLAAAGGMVGSEALMLALAARVGRRTAHRIVHEATARAAARGRAARDELLTDPDIAAVLSRDEVAAYLDREVDTGSSAALVDRMLADA
jgi:adenylosuccinate lyase